VVRQVALLHAAYQQIAIASVNVTAAAEDFRVQNERYRLGEIYKRGPAERFARVIGHLDHADVGVEHRAVAPDADAVLRRGDV